MLFLPQLWAEQLKHRSSFIRAVYRNAEMQKRFAAPRSVLEWLLGVLSTSEDFGA